MKPALIVLLLAGLARAEPIDVTIQGTTQEQAELETLSPPPDIPKIESIPFSLDAGRSAIEGEVMPLSAFEAAMKSDLSDPRILLPPIIPAAPFVVQPLPPMDDPALARFQEFTGRGKERLAIGRWDFSVVDEENHEVYSVSGAGHPPSPLSWDGMVDDAFAIDPNKTYFSFIVLHSTTGFETRIPGEAVRFVGFTRREENDEVITFGSRLYQSDSAQFSDDARIYLLDLSQRLRQLSRFPIGESRHAPANDFTVHLYEPETVEAGPNFRERRKATWLAFLRSALGEKISSDKIMLHPYSSSGSAVRVVLKGFVDRNRPTMVGGSRDPRPQLENKASWVHIKEVKNMLVVELRHDRLFRPGTAYLRDDAVPLVTHALATVRSEIKREAKRGTAGKKKDAERTVLLRSYMEKPRDKKKNQTLEEDPKLAALRSKVLFMLFAHDRLLN